MLKLLDTLGFILAATMILGPLAMAPADGNGNLPPSASALSPTQTVTPTNPDAVLVPRASNGAIPDAETLVPSNMIAPVVK